MEATAVGRTSSELAPLQRAFKLAYECGVEAPTLASSRHDESDMRIASLFLKRTLNDLRCTWVMLGMGYTEPPRDCRRLPTVRGWEHDETDAVFA